MESTDLFTAPIKWMAVKIMPTQSLLSQIGEDLADWVTFHFWD